MNTILKVILAVLGAAVLWLIYTFNRLVVLRMRAKEGLSDIDVQTKRRYDLIPNLVETVKGYMQHERNVLENVTKARTEAMSASGDAFERSKKETVLASTLKTLFAVAENYPNLKANTNFLELQRELTDTEDKIQAARRFYNATVKDLNTKIETFPTRLIVVVLGFNQMKFFEVATSEEREPVKVNF